MLAAPPPTPAAVAAIEEVTQHDVIAFLSAWADNTTPREAAAYVHFGLTSSDLLDTALALQLVEACDVLLAKADALVAALRERGLEHRDTLRVGRTHGIHAEPDVFGHRLADFAFGVARSRDRLRRPAQAVAVAKISGAVGTYSSVDPAVEASVAGSLGLRPADVATQVVLRDGIAEWVSALAIMVTVCEAVGLEVRHGQRTEVREIWEPFRPARRAPARCRTRRTRSCPSGSRAWPGSSAVRAPVTEGIPLWHERDISHSSTERIALPDAATATDYLLRLTTRLVRAWSSTPTGCGPTSSPPAGSSTPPRCCWTWSGPDCRVRTRTRSRRRRRWRPGRAGRRSARRCGRTPRRPGSSWTRRGLEEVMRPERYVARLGPVFDRLAALS